VIKDEPFKRYVLKLAYMHSSRIAPRFRLSFGIPHKDDGYYMKTWIPGRFGINTEECGELHPQTRFLLNFPYRGSLYRLPHLHEPSGERESERWVFPLHKHYTP